MDDYIKKHFPNTTYANCSYIEGLVKEIKIEKDLPGYPISAHSPVNKYIYYIIFFK